MSSLPGNWKQSLAELRTALLKLHKALIDAERLSYETEHGPIKSNGEYLQLLIHNPRFNWLDPYTKLIVACDEAHDSKELLTVDIVNALWNEAGLLTEKQEPISRYRQVLEASPAARALHQEVVSLFNNTV